MTPKRSLLLAGSVVVVAAVVGFSLQRRVDHDKPLVAAQVAESTPQQSQSPADEPAPAKKPLPEVLPGFQLKDRDGALRTLSEWSGRPLIINYWATWCPPCVREIPLLRKLRENGSGMNVEVIGIAVDFRDDVLAFAARENLDYPLLIGEEDGLEAVAAVGMEPAFPFTLFADSKQRIVALKVGELHEDEARLILTRVFAVDKGSMDLAMARAQISEGLKELAVKRAAATPG